MGETELLLTCGEWRARFDPSGALAGLEHGSVGFVDGGHPRPLIVEVGGRRFDLTNPLSCQKANDAVSVHYALPFGTGASLTVSLVYRLLPLMESGVALETVVTLSPDAALDLEVCVRLPAAISLGKNSELFAPRKNGTAYVGVGGPLAGHFAWELAGATRKFLGGYSDALGLPLVSERGNDSPWRLTWCADPYFTTAFYLAPRSLCDAPEREINWRYLGAVGIDAPEERRIYACLHAGNEESSIEAFFETALADIPPGPAWLKEIALCHYDYFSKAGRGWFEDVDTLSEAIPESERHKVCLCLHGWYDRLGSYSMNNERREIEARWRLERSHDLSGQSGFELSREVVVSMLSYARERGFRTTLYYGDGLIAGSEWAYEVLPEGAILHCSGWDEGLAPSVLLNPLHEDVRTWFLDYTRALTAAFGDYVDGFVWDETYFFAAGDLGPKDCPGYLDRAFMRLTREITEVIHAHRDDLAFLGSDDVGVIHTCDGTGRRSVGYSLVADGCWQDSACTPEGWPFGLFPNYRNVIWSCNWWPVGNFAATEYGTKNFGTPAATSNGYGENRALAEFPEGALAKILELFALRAESPRRGFWLSDGDPRAPGPIGTHPVAISIEASAAPAGG